MASYAAYRIIGGARAGNVDFLDVIEAESLSEAEKIVSETYDFGAGEWADVYLDYETTHGGCNEEASEEAPRIQ